MRSDHCMVIGHSVAGMLRIALPQAFELDGGGVHLRILIADDHGIVRSGLRLALERGADIMVVGEAVDGWEAVRLAKELKPDIVIMDIAMPSLNGLDATPNRARQRTRRCYHPEYA